MPFILFDGNCVATVGNAFLVRYLTVAHIFIYMEDIMKKKITNEEIGNAIGKMAEKIRDEMDYDFRVAQSQMWIAENDLVESLDEKQRKLYDDFYKKREKFYYIASELYKRKF